MKTLFKILLFVSVGPAFAQVPSVVSPTESVAADTVLASTKNVKVTRADLDAEMARIPERDRYEFLLNRTRLATVVENILINKTLANEARELGLDKLPKVRDEMDNQVDKVLAKYRGQEIWRTAPAADLLPSARQEYLVNSERFTKPIQYRAWHVLIRNVSRTWAEGYKRAEKVLAEAKRGADLSALAKEYSEDVTSQRNGGENAPVPIDNIEPNIAKELPNLKAGDFAPIIDSPQGFFVVKLIEVIPAKKPTFEEVKNDLLAEARTKYLNAIFETHVNNIRGDPTLKVNVEALDTIRPKIPELPPLPASGSALNKAK